MTKTAAYLIAIVLTIAIISCRNDKYNRQANETCVTVLLTDITDPLSSENGLSILVAEDGVDYFLNTYSYIGSSIEDITDGINKRAATICYHIDSSYELISMKTQDSVLHYFSSPSNYVQIKKQGILNISMAKKEHVADTISILEQNGSTTTFIKDIIGADYIYNGEVVIISYRIVERKMINYIKLPEN